jgi:hypothetical protein
VAALSSSSAELGDRVLQEGASCWESKGRAPGSRPARCGFAHDFERNRLRLAVLREAPGQVGGALAFSLHGARSGYRFYAGSGSPIRQINTVNRI